MKRHTLWIPTLATAALAALVLLLPLAVPADAAGGPEALQIPEQPPGSMMAGGHHAVAQGDSTAAPCPMMEHGGTMGMMEMMGMEHHQMQPEAQATRQRLEELVSRLEATSGEEQMEVMVEIVESLVAERCPMMAGGMDGMDAMDGTGGMHGSAGMHRSTGAESTTR